VSEVEKAFTVLEQAISIAGLVELPGLVGRLATLQAMAWVRLVTPPVHGNGKEASPGPQEGPQEVLLTFQQAAASLKVSPSYVETLVRQGKLEAVTLPATASGTGAYRRERAGRLKRITLAALRALLKPS